MGANMGLSRAGKSQYGRAQAARAMWSDAVPARRAGRKPCVAGEREAVSVRLSGFTLVEVVIAIALIVLVLSGFLCTYVATAYRAEWSACSLAAQALANQQIEQAQSGVWDYSMNKNELTNLSLTAWTYSTNTGAGTGYSWATLDLPTSGTNTIVATNYVTVQMMCLNNVTSPPVQIQMVTVRTVWPFRMFNRFSYFTNTTATYYAPDNRDSSSL